MANVPAGHRPSSASPCEAVRAVRGGRLVVYGPTGRTASFHAAEGANEPVEGGHRGMVVGLGDGKHHQCAILGAGGPIAATVGHLLETGGGVASCAPAVEKVHAGLQAVLGQHEAEPIDGTDRVR